MHVNNVKDNDGRKKNWCWILDAPLSAGFPLRYNWLWMRDIGCWLLDAGAGELI